MVGVGLIVGVGVAVGDIVSVRVGNGDAEVVTVGTAAKVAEGASVSDGASVNVYAWMVLDAGNTVSVTIVSRVTVGCKVPVEVGFNPSHDREIIAMVVRRNSRLDFVDLIIHIPSIKNTSLRDYNT
jgi:hypothetical protein